MNLIMGGIILTYNFLDGPDSYGPYSVDNPHLFFNFLSISSSIF